MARLPTQQLSTNTKELDLGSGSTVYHMPDWHQLSHPKRLAVLRQIALMRGRDPRIAKLVLSIIKKAKAPPRNYVKQAAAILRWVQNPKNVYYVNEPGERLQDPVYTIKVGMGDCDDEAILLGTMFESIALPWRLVLSGRTPQGQKVRYIEGQATVPNASWAHIYVMVGDRPFRPVRWFFAEPTVQGVPLGWDVISGSSKYLPEMANGKSSQSRIVKLKSPPPGHKKAPLPPKANQSPAYALAYGSISSAVGSAVAEEASESSSTWQRMAGAIAMGVAVSVGTQIALDFVRGSGIWKDSGDVVTRAKALMNRVL